MSLRATRSNLEKHELQAARLNVDLGVLLAAMDGWGSTGAIRQGVRREDGPCVEKPRLRTDTFETTQGLTLFPLELILHPSCHETVQAGQCC